jgi:hypothetical protein
MVWAYIFGQAVVAGVALLTYLSSRKVHGLVNSSATEARDRIEQLARALTAAGVDVPPSATADAPALGEQHERLAPRPRPSGGHL